MITRIIFIAVLVAAILAAPFPALGAVGKWEPTGPYAGDVRALAQDPNQTDRLFAGTRFGGVYLSEDSGDTWTPRSEGLTEDPTTNSYRPILGVTLDPALGRLYATGVDIFLSEDNGLTWSTFPRPGNAVGNFGVLYLDPDDPQKLTVLNQNGIFVYDLVNATDRDWSQPSGIASAPVFNLVRAPSDPDRFYAVAGYDLTLYHSTDRVGSWSPVVDLPGTEFRALAVDASDPSRLYLSLDTGCFLSTNSGQAWTRMDDPADDAQIFAFADVSGELMAVGRGSVFSNTADADKLAPVLDFWHTPATSAVVREDGTLLLGTRMGLFEAPTTVVNGSGEFVLKTQGMNNAGIAELALVQGSDVIYAAAGSGYNAGVFRSDDNGQTWKLRSLGITNLDVRSIAASPSDPDIAYAGTLFREDIGENGKVFKTVDGGLTWTETGELPHDPAEPRIIIRMLVHPTNPDVVYASMQGVNGGIAKSLDGGTTWARYADGLESMPLTPGHEDFHEYYAMLSMEFDPGNPETVYLGAGGCWGGVYRSTNGGNTWNRRSQCCMEFDSKPIEFGDPDFWFPVHLELWATLVDPANSNHLLTAGTRGDYLTAERVGILFESWDAGESWDLIRETARDDYFSVPLTGMAIHRYRPGEIYLSNVTGAQMSLDGGSTWNDINEGLGTQFTRRLAFDADDPNRLYLATASRGIWTRELSPVAVRLTHLEIRDLGGSVELAWGVADAVNHLGFHVDREVAGERVRITEGLLRGQEEYRLVDSSPVPGAVNRYWVVEVDRTGKATEFGPLEIRPTAALGVMQLGRPAPNPLRTESRIRLTPAGGEVSSSVRVFDTRGRRVATLLDAVALSAPTWVSWNGTDDRGVRVPGGIYFIQAISGDAKRVQRILVVP